MLRRAGRLGLLRLRLGLGLLRLGMGLGPWLWVGSLLVLTTPRVFILAMVGRDGLPVSRIHPKTDAPTNRRQAIDAVILGLRLEVISKYGRHDWTRTSDLYRVKVAL